MTRLLPLLSAAVVVAANVADKPNIVLVLADDLGYSDVTWNNAGVVTTPYMNNLRKSEFFKKRSARLTNSYATHRCSPSRAALLSGYYPYRYGLGKDAIKSSLLPAGIPDKPTFLDGERMKLIPEYLRDAGYSTHLVGKWHLGQARTEYYPTERGFDTFYGFTASQVDFWPRCGQSYDEETKVFGKAMMKDQDNWFKYKEDTYCTPDFTNKALSILEDKSNEKPKFIYLSYNAPHLPIQAPKDDVDKLRKAYKKKGVELSDEILTYHAMIRSVDDGMKALLKSTKKETEAGGRETIFIFSSDNGAVSNFDKADNKTYPNGFATGAIDGIPKGTPDPAFERVGCNYPYKGLKDNMEAEGGTKVPTMVISTDRKFKKNQFSQLVHFVDWFPTILDLAGHEGSRPGNMDGVSANWMFQNKKIPDEKRSPMIYGVKHMMTRDKETNGFKWIVTYAVRWQRNGKDLKYMNFARTRYAWRCPAFKQTGAISKLIKKINKKNPTYMDDLEAQTLDKPGDVVDKTWNDYDNESLFDLRNDPFETNNLLIGDKASQSQLEQVTKIKQWVEKKLNKGDIPIPVTGNTSGHLKDLLSEIYYASKWKKMETDDMMEESGRQESAPVCEIDAENNWAYVGECVNTDKQPNLNFADDAIAMDKKYFDRLMGNTWEWSDSKWKTRKNEVDKLSRAIPYLQDMRASWTQDPQNLEASFPVYFNKHAPPLGPPANE